MARSKARRRLWRDSARRWIAAAATLAAAGGLLWLWILYRKVDAFLEARSLSPLRIYSESLAIRPGMDVDGIRLEARLRRLGYEEVRGGSREPGRFRRSGGRLEIALRPFPDPDGEHPAGIVQLDLHGSLIEGIRRLPDGHALEEARLEPELLGSYSGGVLGERRVVPLDALPRHVVTAVLAVEDARFATHRGIDPIGLVRAAWVNLRGRRIRQGGSTITQQLAKNLFLTPERGLVRKGNEAVLAVILEARLSKEEILELYLNEVYLGRSGSVGIYGVGQAARAFFGKDARELTPTEAATIAGVIHSPNTDSPLRHPERARARRDQVLALMAENGWIGKGDLEAARKQPLRLGGKTPVPLQAPFFVDEVLRRLERMGHEPERVRGIRIYTTVDLEAQHAAERALASGLEALEKRYARLRRAERPIEGAIVLVEAQTGFVRALAGGRDFSRSQFNRVTRSLRQPGSAFKPFVYLAAIDEPGDVVTPSTILRDEPLRLQVGRTQWTPTNYDGRYLGEVTVRAALEGSRNVPTVELARRIGLERIATLARLSGLRGAPEVPAMVLGAGEVSLIGLTAAYTVFPNLGEVARPALIRAVVTDAGQVLYRDQLRRKRVATAAGAYVTSHLLEGVIDAGTGAAVRRLGISQAVAGKTGTTNDEKDAWFIGYSPDWVGGAWVGFDDGTPVGLTGAEAALPLWVGLMRELLAGYGDRPFPVPSGVVFVDVDRQTGLVATWACPDSVREAFIEGTDPIVTCDGREIAPASGSPRGNPLTGMETVLRRWFGGR